MESSEDDAGTATNASRRASAREKDVGLAEDVNATSSFQQKPSEARSSCQTPAMSEDNFDGDSVPSPSSQDVNTSTEAILDMIDEIVDGPGAPKRLPLTSDFVDALNEEFAATSYNLNIIQESVKSDSENISLPPEVASSVNNADSEVTLPASIDKPTECSTPSEVPTDNVKTDSVDLLPASSSVAGSEEKTVSTGPEDSSNTVSNVETETSSSCPLPNIPSSSEEQTDQNILDTSVCESQDRTVKCVTSSDNRDNVTVESAESTSSDSSVSESKTLLVEPQTRSPLRRRLVRPAPSDRRPDSTVSSTADSQIVNIATEQTSSEITKDVTSSSDAVPTIHGNVKPDEISNVSEINFCKAETSVSPPKKIKLIRQKNITGTSNRETPISQISDLAQKEQCQSTSSDNHSVNLPIPATTELSSTDCMSQSKDHTESLTLDNSKSVSEKLPERSDENPKSVYSEEHSLPSRSELQCSPKRDVSSNINTDTQCISDLSTPNPSESSECGVGSQKSEQEIRSLPVSNSSESIPNLKVNDIGQGNITYNTYDNDLKSVDFIPLILPPQSKKQQSIKNVFESTNVEPKHINSVLQTTKSKPEIESSKVQLISSEPEAKSCQSESNCSDLEIKNTLLDIKENDMESTSSEQKSSSTAPHIKIDNIESKSCVPLTQCSGTESKNDNVKSTEGELQTKTCDADSKRSEIELSGICIESSDTMLESKLCDLESKGSKEEPKCSEVDPERNVVDSKSSEADSETYKEDSVSSIVDSKCSQIESKSSEVDSKSTEVDSKSSEVDSKSSEVDLKSSEVDSKSSEVDSKSSEVDSKSIEVDLKSSVINSKSSEVDSKTSELDSKSSQIQSESNVAVSNSSALESENSKVEELEHKSTIYEPESINSKLESSNTEIQPNIQVLESISSELKPAIIETPLTGCRLQLSSNELESKNIEVKRIEADSGSIGNISMDVEHNELAISTLDTQASSSEPIISEPETAQNEIETRNTDIESKKTQVEEKKIEYVENMSIQVNCQIDDSNEQQQEDQKKVPPIKLNLTRSSISTLSESKLEIEPSSIIKNSVTPEESDSTKQVPKLTIKLKQSEEMKSPVPKVTIKPIRPPVGQDMADKMDSSQQVPCVTKLNIKPIVKPPENDNDQQLRSQVEVENKDAKMGVLEQQLPCITKLNIKPILKPPEKINDIHRKSSSSEISESECSENDETTSTSDQASASDHGSSDVVPKVTIKLGKPGTESEGKFYTEKNIPKLTIKGIQQDDKLFISQSDDTQPEKIPKLTIKTVTKAESQPLSPKLTIKPLKPPDSTNKDSEILKIKISTESYSSTTEGKESPHVPKITIKPVTRMDDEPRTPKKSVAMCDSPDHIPVVTKINIKPILKPTDSGDSSEGFDDKVPVVSKLNIKPVIKPKDNDVDSSVDDVPKITKLNIKPLKNPEETSSEDFKDCDELNADIGENSIPVVTKINIKPIIKPQEEEKEKEAETLSSETGNSSDDNTDHIPVVTKLNIKPIVKPEEMQEASKPVLSEPSIPIVTKLNIKPLVKPGDSSPSSPKKEHSKIDVHNTPIPVVTKLNIKPVVRPEEETPKSKDTDSDDRCAKNPPLVMKINMKSVSENVNHESSQNESLSPNYVGDGLLSKSQKSKMCNELEKLTEKKEYKSSESETVNDLIEPRVITHSPVDKLKQNCVTESIQKNEESTEKTSILKKSLSKSSDAVERQHSPKISTIAKCDSVQKGLPLQDSNAPKEGKIALPNETHVNQDHKNTNFRSIETIESNVKQPFIRQKVSSVQNCTLLKKLLENTRDSLDKNLEVSQIVNCTLTSDRSESTLSACKNIVNSEYLIESGKSGSRNINDSLREKDIERRSDASDKVNDLNKSDSGKLHSLQELSEKVNENVTKPLEITVTDKFTNDSSGQDSPRIILKINKTDHGPSAKIITEDVKRPDTIQNYVENTQDNVNDKQSPKRHITNSRRKQTADTSLNLSAGKRLRSSRIVENTEKSQVKRNMGKRPSTADASTPQNKETELTTLQSKRLKLGQLLSANKPLSITPVASPVVSPTKSLEIKPGIKTPNHSLLNNENCSKNGNSKLHNILSNLQAKQMQALPYNNTNCSERTSNVHSDIECNASMSSSEAVEVTHVENSHPELQQMIINENSDFRDLTGPEDTSQDPLEVDNIKPTEVPPEVVDIPKPVELTPQPKKRGRPRKLPVSEGAKPVAVTLPVPALEERPQRSLRLMRDRPAILLKPRGGRGRGRGGRRSEATPPAEPEPVTIVEPATEEQAEERPTAEIDPTSSRIKLPRMTEALDKMPSVCTTPLSSRRRNSSGNFSTGDTPELKAMLDSTPPKDDFPNTPEPSGSGRGRGGRGSRGGRGRTPRGRGRGRGGGRGAMYMKETLGIYGRVCGPATTTVQLFEEETCMMDDNATPAKPSHLLDEDSHGSVKSSTNESNKMKKSKFADLFDSNKVWTAADVKEYTWPSPDKGDGEQKIMMIQEQVAMFLGVKSFKRRYPELKRRTIVGEERDYVLSKGLVTEALCDLGITAVDASEVLDIMLSDYPHKYEEFRSHQRQRQLAEVSEEPVEEAKPEEKVTRVEMKPEKPVEHKPDLPKIDPEKTRQDMAAAAAASASEWNARANAWRRGACADLQSFTVLRARPRPAPPRTHLRPPAGFYPHALLPGQYQHSYRVYTPDQLRYFPLNTVLAAPPAPVSVTDWSSDSEPDWGSRCSSSDDSDAPTHHNAKRKKVSKVKRSSHAEASTSSASREESRGDEVVDTCRVCKLRLEANRKYTHERFLVCANCNAKLHPSCVDLSADTIRKCREYPWQCAECKTCCSCRQPADDDKMLFCDLCDRGFHIYCVGLDTVPSGRWHCVECAVCKSCGARSPGGPQGAGAAPGPPAPADWHHQTRRGPGGHKVYSHSLCTPCARVR